MWMGSAASEAETRGPSAAQRPPGGTLPALAGGSPELDGEAAAAESVPATTGVQPEVAFVAILAGAATIFFGIIPEPLFNLVRGVGNALGLF
jgi:hypothetical protein